MCVFALTFGRLGALWDEEMLCGLIEAYIDCFSWIAWFEVRFDND